MSTSLHQQLLSALWSKRQIYLDIFCESIKFNGSPIEEKGCDCIVGLSVQRMLFFSFFLSLFILYFKRELCVEEWKKINHDLHDAIIKCIACDWRKSISFFISFLLMDGNKIKEVFEILSFKNQTNWAFIIRFFFFFTRFCSLSFFHLLTMWYFWCGVLEEKKKNLFSFDNLKLVLDIVSNEHQLRSILFNAKNFCSFFIGI